MTVSLTRRQAAALSFLRRYMAEHGQAPSCEELIKALGLASKSGATRILRGLEERGHIRRLAYRTRAIELIGGAPVIDLAALAEPELKALAGRVAAELDRRDGR